MHVVTLGVHTQMHELQHAMEDCLLTGYWLVIQNAHLAEAWPEDTLTLIKVLYLTFYFAISRHEIVNFLRLIE